jgi:hypothetical protein
MMGGAVCLDWEDPDRIRLSMARCPAQPEQTRPMSASGVPPKQLVRLSIGGEFASQVGNVGYSILERLIAVVSPCSAGSPPLLP